jgi:folylpolyglutamate synthase/dihydropteroate synthase
MTETGFYSSPHLVSTTERIRINGKPLTQEKFAKHFWEVYDKVVRNQDDKPAYFKFLTILAFNVFIKEDVDVAVIEVGIGGKYTITFRQVHSHTSLIGPLELHKYSQEGMKINQLNLATH